MRKITKFILNSSAIFLLLGGRVSFAQNIGAPTKKNILEITSSDTAAEQKKQWQAAYSAYQKQISQYWDKIAEKRKIRNKKRQQGQTIQLEDYVLTQPPIYTGPEKPLEEIQTPNIVKSTIPNISDFLVAAKNIYNFTPELPMNETEFMQNYADAAKSLGFNREQIVAIYAFETGGIGTYDLQAGMIKGQVNATPISTALGYNQLVATASVSLMWEFGDNIAKTLNQQAKQATGQRKQILLAKVDIIKKMTKMAKNVPHIWNEQAKLAKTEAGLGMHAMLLDKDIGPLMQIYKLKTTLNFLKYKGFKRQLSGAEFEMLNLTGDGNGYDMITMPKSLQDKVPSSNFFLHRGYDRNSIAQRYNTVSQLLAATEAKMQEYTNKQGAKMLYQAF